MIRSLLLCAMIATPALAQETVMPAGAEEGEAQNAVDLWEADRATIFDARDVDLADFQWIARPVVIFADTPADPRFQRQMDLITARPDDLTERDVVLIVDTDPDAASDIRVALRPRGFMLAIMGKDGTVLIRKPLPWDLREITRNIDKLPLREQEIRDRRAEEFLSTQ